MSRWFPLPLVFLAACSGCGSNGFDGETGTGTGDLALRLETVATGLSNPLLLTAPPGDARLFIVEQPGRVRIVENGALLPAPFLDVTAKVTSGGERGLLGLAFHPQYATNGLLFVNYTDRNGDTKVERYRVGADRNRADPASAREILSIRQPFANHNGGHLAFGPDGLLWIGTGDGGSGGDPQNHGQNAASLLGKLLRIDVDRADPYGIPASNPFAGRTDARGEIWALGLRNPWRFSFDRGDGTLYVADVGQNALEEVNAVPATAAGLNYGWATMEGTQCFRPSAGCDQAGLTLPVLEYGHDDGCSVTGGYVYRGAAIPALRGTYFYGDYCGGWVRSFRRAGGAVTDRRSWPALSGNGNVLSFGEDAAGELYVLVAEGRVYRIVRG